MFKKIISIDSIIANFEQTESLQKMLEEKNQLIEQLQNQKPLKSSPLNVSCWVFDSSEIKQIIFLSPFFSR